MNTASNVSNPLVSKTKAKGNRQKVCLHHLIHLTTAVGSHLHTVSRGLLQTFNTALAASREILQARLLYSNGLFVDHGRDA